MTIRDYLNLHLIYFFCLKEENVFVTVCLAMTGKFAISISYLTIQLISSEIFPTTIRGTCQGAWYVNLY